MITIALAQINPTVGDVAGNAELAVSSIERAVRGGAAAVALPELAITGYPPEDLLLKRSFIDANVDALNAVAAKTDDILAVIGFVEPSGDRLYNSAALCHGGRVVAIYRKHLLPNYGVFDEHRYFESGRGHILIETPEGVLGVCVCEDAWSAKGPVVTQGDAGAQVVININASPYHKNKLAQRIEMLGERARRARSSIVYLNSVGGQDELVFDGGSLVIDSTGEVVARLPQFEEYFAAVDVPLGIPATTKHPSIKRISVPLRSAHGGAVPAASTGLGPIEEIYGALCLGLADYVRKNGFEEVVVGLSGGIDSALTATIAADALGAERVLAVAMPSEFSTSHSVDDAKALAENLEIELLHVPIARVYHAYIEMMRAAFGPAEMGLAEENLQARIRGNTLMAISNRYGHLVLATGNKSEMACGYATLYGDMAGGFAVLKDVLKTEVYALAAYRNSSSEVIPENILTKPPSAELRPDQKDSDSLPPYDELDPILEAYIEDDAGIDDIVQQGHDRDVVEKVVRLVDRAEYKRRQAPPGPKVTTKAFGRDRRLPITNGWREESTGPAHLPQRSVGRGRGNR
jgi:NAD+ synthase (glutamine-hydrolysing)